LKGAKDPLLIWGRCPESLDGLTRDGKLPQVGIPVWNARYGTAIAVGADRYVRAGSRKRRLIGPGRFLEKRSGVRNPSVREDEARLFREAENAFRTEHSSWFAVERYLAGVFDIAHAGQPTEIVRRKVQGP
jgi:hypothetical protein